MEGYKPGAECAECKGKCCKERGCSLSPEDMWKALGIAEKAEFPQDMERYIHKALQRDTEQVKESILDLLKDPEGNYAIDYFSTESGPLFFLRMRHKCYTFIGVDAMGECVALTETGCSLSEEERPKGGRYLKSSPDRRCEQLYTKEMMQADWAPYRKILGAIWKEYEEKFKNDGTFDKCDADYFAWMKAQRER